MKKKKQHEEEHVDETWLLPYSDMMTLLLALFIVMFAMSKVDSEKFQALSKSFNVIFSGSASIVNSTSGTSTSIVSVGNSSTSTTSQNASTAQATEQDKMTELRNKLQQEIQKSGYADKVKAEVNQEGLYITIQDVVLFRSGDANILDNVSPLLTQISGMISGLDNKIKVVGHTDNVPISGGQFKSNWDLSAARAIDVMQFMVNAGKLNQDKISIQAYGEFMPIADNSTEEGKSKNRRVEILILRQYPTTTTNK